MTPSALFVTTVPITLEAFLTPFAEHFRSCGWRIDAAARGASCAPRIASSFDARFDVDWSRNPPDPRNMFGAAKQIRQIVEKGRYDIVHVHTPVASFVTRWALRRTRRDHGGPLVIYTAHGFHFFRGQGPLPHALYRSLERAAAPWTDYLVTINKEDFEAARSLSGLPRDHVRLIPGIGVDVERFADGAVSSRHTADVRREVTVAPDAFMLTMIAEFSPVKRHEHLLQALSGVRDRRVVLVLAGDGPLEAQLRERVADLGLADRVRFAGYRRDIPELLAASDALVLTSEREGLNRSVLEAMASARPVIGTDTRGIADAVGSDAGWIVPKDDATALSRAIEQAASDPAECRRRGQEGRARAVNTFALSRIITDYEGLYREALASRV